MIRPQVDCDPLVPCRNRKLFHRGGASDHRVIDDDVDSAEGFFSVAEHLLDFPRPAKVGARVEGADAACLLDCGFRLRDYFRLGKPAENNVAPGCRETVRSCEPESAD
jgi:hypothetical protein